MPDCDWIICEQSNRWAAALRMAAERDTATGGGCYRLREVRRLGELASELARRPASLVAVEVRDKNLGDVLAWLSAAERQFPWARCVALVDRSLSSENPTVGPDSEDSLHDVCDTLREAGALEVAESPRRLRPLLELARHHAMATAQHQAIVAENVPFALQVWATLPWQEA
jgi:hypothetical protein